MRLSSFRVQHFRNVIDSGKIDIHDLTAIVGQNEGGKSNLCEALSKLNPFDVSQITSSMKIGPPMIGAVKIQMQSFAKRRLRSRMGKRSIR